MFTLEELMKLKYRDLNKLAVRYKVYKKWAKKEDVIRSLLSLNEGKDAEIGSGTKTNKSCDTLPNCNILPIDEKWCAGEAFSFGSNQMKFTHSEDTPCINRSTFNIERSNGSSPKINSDCKEDDKPVKSEGIDRRLTYDVFPANISLGTEVAADKHLKHNTKKLGDKETNELLQSKNVGNKILQLKSEAQKKESFISTTENTICSKGKENVCIDRTKRRISKSFDPTIIKNSTINLKTNLGTTPMKQNGGVRPMKSSSVARISSSVQKNVDHKLSENQKHGTAMKSRTGTKMPNFSSIHKKRFDKMESLEEFQQKKAERARKLFGVNDKKLVLKEQVAVKQTKKVFHTSEKNRVSNMKPVIHTPQRLQIPDKEGKLPTPRREFGIRDKNRSLIQGVRSNKRFELQMKFRNMKN